MLLRDEIKDIIIEALKEKGRFESDDYEGDKIILYADDEDTEEYVKITIEELW